MDPSYISIMKAIFERFFPSGAAYITSLSDTQRFGAVQGVMLKIQLVLVSLEIKNFLIVCFKQESGLQFINTKSPFPDLLLHVSTVVHVRTNVFGACVKSRVCVCVCGGGHGDEGGREGQRQRTGE